MALLDRLSHILKLTAAEVVFYYSRLIDNLISLTLMEKKANEDHLKYVTCFSLLFLDLDLGSLAIPPNDGRARTCAWRI